MGREEMEYVRMMQRIFFTGPFLRGKVVHGSLHLIPHQNADRVKRIIPRNWIAPSKSKGLSRCRL
jgi:hypothetical protein